MDLIGYLETERDALPLQARVGLWRNAVSTLSRACGPEELHTRLSPASFSVQEQEGQVVVTLTDRERIQPFTSAAVTAAVWPYAAPEQTGLVSEPFGEVTNVYSVALIGYYLLTGKEPIPETGRSTLAETIVRGVLPVPDLSGAGEEAEALIGRILTRATAKRPADRLGSLSALDAELAILESSIAGGETAETSGLVGRQREYTLLRELLDRVRSGAGEQLLLTGEPGQGKSYLWSRFVDRERRASEVWLLYKSPQTGRVPYGALTTLLRELQVTAESRGLRGISSLPQRTREIVSILLPEYRSGVAEERSLPDEGNYELLRATRDLCTDLVPIIVAIDDLQWIDEQSLSVLQSLSESIPHGVGLMFIGRPEATARLAPSHDREEIRLGGLEEGEARQLLELLRSGRFSGSSGGQRFRLVNRYAQGNPLALIHLADRFESGDSHAIAAEMSSHSRELLSSLARSRLALVGDAARNLLRFLALLLPPVPTAYLRWAELFEPLQLRELLERCERALLLVVEDEGETIAFSHDSIETFARAEAMEEGRVISQAISVLRRAARAGDERALFALAHLIATGRGASEEETLTAVDAVDVLYRAAERALRTRAPADALRFAQRALEVFEAGDRSELVLQLHIIAHRAAYDLDEVLIMSRHFARIYAFRDSLSTNRASRLWINRAYANSNFDGAALTGWRALEDLGMLTDGLGEDELQRRATRYLTSRSVTSVERALLRQRSTEDPISALKVSIASSLLLPMLFTNRERLAVLAYVVFTEGLSRGLAPETGIGFVAWRLWESTARISPRRIGQMTQAAFRLAVAGGDPTASHSIRTYAAVFALVWTDRYDRGMAQLRALYREGLELNNFHFASHCTHLLVQAELYHGRPLEKVFESMQHALEEMSSYHHYRNYNAVAKYAQAVECLLGRTSDPFRLTGSIIDERLFLEDLRKQADLLSQEGFIALKGLLALFGGRPKEALAHFRRFDRRSPYTAALHDNAVVRFFWGFLEFLYGEPGEGRFAMSHVRRWARAVPQNHRHRYLALRGAENLRKGHKRRGLRLLDRARVAALKADYPHEAALLAEVHAQRLTVESPRREELLHLAHSLYSRWGAANAAERIRSRLNWRGSATTPVPTVLDEALVQSLLEAPQEEELLERAIDHLFAFSGAEQGFIYWTATDRRELYAVDANGGRYAGEYEPGLAQGEVLREVLTRAVDPATGELSEVVGSGELARQLFLVESFPFEQSRLRIGLLSAPGGGRFSELLRTRISTGGALVTALLRLRRVSRRSREQQQDLATARQAAVEAEEYARTLFGSISEALILLSSGYSVLSYNPAARSYLRGSTEQEPELDGELLRRIEALTPGLPDTAESELSWGDQQLRVLLTPAPSPENPGEPIYAVSISDITEARRNEEVLRRREKELIIADRMSSLGMLSATIAHEVSNPNHIVQLNAQALLMLLEQLKARAGNRDSEAIEEAEALIEQILEGGHRIEEVVSRIKEYGREGRSDQRELLEVDATCRRALRFSRIMAAQYTSNLRYEPAAELPRVLGVPGLLEQAIINLIKNGCEALLDSSGRVRLATRFDEASREVVISVSDDGAGVDPRKAARITEPFSSSRSDRGGTGLGLSIVQTILDAHGGRFSLREGEEYTTVAEMRLPTVES